MEKEYIRVKRYSKKWKKKVSVGWFKKELAPWNKGIPLNKEWKRKLSEAKKGKTAWNKGRKMSEEQRIKMIGTLKGVHRSPKTEFKKGEGVGNKNNAKKPGVGEKISKAKKGKPHLNQRRENHPRWGGDETLEKERIRKRIEYKLWRETIFSRDNWTCQKCKEIGGKLNAHHIFNFADFSGLRISTDNGITLCNNCHKKFHATYGFKNNTKEKFNKFLNT
jgi:5-methylcytosine-specific restriction endonuclease McrA